MLWGYRSEGDTLTGYLVPAHVGWGLGRLGVFHRRRRRRRRRRQGGQNGRKSDFSGMGVPDRENVPTPRGSILRPTTASQRTYRANINFFICFLDFGL